VGPSVRTRGSGGGRSVRGWLVADGSSLDRGIKKQALEGDVRNCSRERNIKHTT
jgi:hypothetical protein